MFDIDRLKAKGIDQASIEILEKINENERKRIACECHDFSARMFSNGKIECKNCGCVEDIRFVVGYEQGLAHGRMLTGSDDEHQG